ncbi:hypothetical protein CEXT_168761 [Caerostris extrusa]|uniref:Uncharacterized protein n=1 Tax=Caerostris extrusa TaxID=172846 RepID=A0AAV4NLB9_CAEEX|nr:hypothetical protein CEXT_168761 [Caerostris extrusa]
MYVPTTPKFDTLHHVLLKYYGSITAENGPFFHVPPTFHQLSFPAFGGSLPCSAGDPCPTKMELGNTCTCNYVRITREFTTSLLLARPDGRGTQHADVPNTTGCLPDQEREGWGHHVHGSYVQQSPHSHRTGRDCSNCPTPKLIDKLI